MNLTLSQFLVYLINKRPFYGRLVSSLERVAKPGLGTMAVGLREGRAVLFCDPEFLVDLSIPAGMMAVEHEMLHIVLDHIPRYLELLASLASDAERAKAAAVFGRATDAVVNWLLREHEGFAELQAHMVARLRKRHPGAPDDAFIESKAGLVMPGKLGLPPDGTFESYQHALMRRVRLVEVDVTSMLDGNTHEFWNGDPAGDDGQDVMIGKLPVGMSPEDMVAAAHRIRDQLKETMREVVRGMGGIGRGTLPGDVEEWLREYLAPPIMPWWEVLAAHAKMSRLAKRRRSVQVPNRATIALSEEDASIIPSPGRVRDQSWRVIFVVDTSGSMSSDSLRVAKSELKHMLEVDDGMEVRYIQGDCVVRSDVLLRAGDDVPAEVHGRGGTDFDAYFAHMRQYEQDAESRPDLAIVYTDGYAPPVSPGNRLSDETPVLWLVTPEHAQHFNDGYGTVIACDPAHNARYKG